MDLKEKLRLKTANPASAAPVKLAFLGDSVTHGCFEIIEKAAGCFELRVRSGRGLSQSSAPAAGRRFSELPGDDY